MRNRKCKKFRLYSASSGASQVALLVKNQLVNAGDRVDPWVRKSLWRRAWQPTPIFLPGEAHRQRSLAGYGPWGCRESDTTDLACRHSKQQIPRELPADVASENRLNFRTYK